MLEKTLMDGAVSFWSDEMFGHVRRLTYRYSRQWYIERDDLFQEGCYWLTRWAAKNGDAPISVALITRIVRNGCHAYIRRFKRPHLRVPMRAIPDAAETAPSRPSVDVKLDVRLALEELTHAQSDAIRECVYRHRSLAEYAESRGIARDTAQKTSSRAYEKMRPVLAGGYGPAVDRKCTQSRRRARMMTGRHMNWNLWGPIPNQRKDENA